MGRPIADVSARERAEICELYADGKNKLIDIAGAYDLTDGTVSEIARLGGMPPRQRRVARVLEDASFDPGRLAVEEMDGEPRIRDVVLGEALGYDRPRKIRDLIARLRGPLAELGKLPHRGAVSGGSRGPLAQEYLLNQKQVNYLITRCGLPRADEWCVHVARVFTAWQNGRIAELETIVELQDSAEAVAESLPELDGIQELIKAATAGLATKEDIFRIERKIDAGQRRKNPTVDTRAQFIRVVLLHYNGRCPSCSQVEVVRPNGVVNGHFDHWTDCPSKNGAHEMWLVCEDCNKGFETRKLDRQAYAAEFAVFQKRRRQTGNPLLMDIPESRRR